MGNGTSRRPRPVYKLAVTTTHTLADLNTLFIPREGSPPPPCLSARGTPSSSSYTWLMSRGHPRCPNFYRLSRCFHPFPPLEGLNDFNHPFFLPSLSFSHFIPFPAFSSFARGRKHKEMHAQSYARNCDRAIGPPCTTLENVSPLARFRRNSIDTHANKKRLYLRLIGCIVTFLCQG